MLLREARTLFVTRQAFCDEVISCSLYRPVVSELLFESAQRSAENHTLYIHRIVSSVEQTLCLPRLSYSPLLLVAQPVVLVNSWQGNMRQMRAKTLHMTVKHVLSTMHSEFHA